MTEKPSKSNEPAGNSIFQNQTFVIAMIGVVGTIIAAIISVTPQIYELTRNPTDTPIPTLTFTLEPTTLPTETPTELLPTDTATQIPPTPTETITPSPTPVDPGIACLDRWQVISSNPDLAVTDGAGNCAQASVPALGISASKAGINFGKNSLREQGTFGIATSLPADATVTLQVEFMVLTQGEFWIALSNTPNPENNMMILALQPSTGEVRIYSDQTSRYSYASKYSELLQNTILSPSVLPYTYKITFVISGNRVNTKIHSTTLPVQSVNLPKYLFLGFTNKSTLGSLTVQVDVNNLSVEAK
jgi:hypothetical protein